MTTFTVRGRYRSRDGWSPFESAVVAPNESVARERTYANLGSRHGLRRDQVRLEEVEGT